MTFWERVIQLAENKDISKKELAMVGEIDISTISKGLKSDKSPSADVAVKIADRLGTTVEYLVTGTIQKTKNVDSYIKYEPLLKNLNKLSENAKSNLTKFLSDISADYSPEEK